MQQHHHVEQRGAARIALRRDRLDQPLERRLVVGEGVQHGVLHGAEEVAEGASSVHCGAQHDGVDEEPDQPVQLGPVAAGGDGTDGDVLLTGVPGEQRLARGHQEGEQRGLHGAGEVGQPPGDCGGDRGLVHRTGRGPHRRARPVGRQLHRRYPGKPPPPVAHLLVKPGTGEPLALPDRVVRVLHRQRVELRTRVPPAQLLHHEPHGPAVDDDVVRGQQEDVLLRA